MHGRSGARPSAGPGLIPRTPNWHCTPPGPCIQHWGLPSRSSSPSSSRAGIGVEGGRRVGNPPPGRAGRRRHAGDHRRSVVGRGLSDRLLNRLAPHRRDVERCTVVRRASPTGRSRNSLERPDNPAGDPAAVETARLRDHLFAVHRATVHRRSHHGNRTRDGCEIMAGL